MSPFSVACKVSVHNVHGRDTGYNPEQGLRYFQSQCSVARSRVRMRFMLGPVGEVLSYLSLVKWALVF